MTFHTSMTEALRLTRSGNLMEATALIQTALSPARPAALGPLEPTGEVIALVPEQILLRAPGSSDARPAPEPSPPSREHDDRARFEQRSYRGSAGTMTYWLYHPAKAAANAPLVLMLHGCSQSAQDFARGTGMNRLAEELGFVVAYPQQSLTANPQKCWNWFRPGDQQRDRGEPAQLAGVTRQVIAEQSIDPQRVYVAGLSAGGAAAAIMASQYPDLYAAVGIHSGIACGVARDLPTAFSAMQQGAPAGRPKRGGVPFVPLIAFHGDRDATVNAANCRQIVAEASVGSGVSLTVRVENSRSNSGRAFSRTQSVGPDGAILIEQWMVEGLGHAWSGGDASGSYTDPSGPEASRAMMRFFLEHACKLP